MGKELAGQLSATHGDAHLPWDEVPSPELRVPLLDASCKDCWESALSMRRFPAIAGESLIGRGDMISVSPRALTDKVLPGRADPGGGKWFLRFGWERQTADVPSNL